MSTKKEFSETNKKIYGLLRKDLHRIRHEIAVTTRALRTQQGLFYKSIERVTGGFLSPHKLERIEMERINVLPLQTLITLAIGLGRRLSFSFEEPHLIGKPSVPGAGWEPANRTALYSYKQGTVGYQVESLRARQKAKDEATLAAAAETLATSETPPTSSESPKETVAEPTDSKID